MLLITVTYHGIKNKNIAIVSYNSDTSTVFQ